VRGAVSTRLGAKLKSRSVRAQHVLLPLLAAATLLAASWLAPVHAAPVHAAPVQNRWSQVTTPSSGSARSIGEYSAGCLRGAARLPLDGVGYQVMHPSRLRYYGHPELIDFITKLGRAVHAEGLGPVMVGDLSQPRGGPAPGGHSSHQTGLDVDLWFWQPKAAEHGPLPTADRESLKSRSVLGGKTADVRPEFLPRVAALLRLTVSDPRVNRIFVNPMIKRALCADAQSDRAWLSKVRPWYGHDDHFHVRLECPEGQTACIPQTPVADGDGCDSLGWWFDKTAQAEADRDKGRATYQAKVGKAAGMPAECGKLIEGVAPPPLPIDAGSGP
jgi:penicillin-insensitive murein endopeptidase